MFVYVCSGNDRLLLATEILTLGKFYAKYNSIAKILCCSRTEEYLDSERLTMRSTREAMLPGLIHSISDNEVLFQSMNYSILQRVPISENYKLSGSLDTDCL